MKRSKSLINILCFGALFCLLMAFLVGQTNAAFRLEVPEESPGSPFYARIERGLIHHTEQWAAVTFYRSPECVPLDFNLLDLFDMPPRPFFCPLTVEGFEIWKNGPQQDMAPIQSKLHGLGEVPVWFVDWPELQKAIEDNILTITELQSMVSLQIGSATYFEETLHPLEGSKQTKLELNAEGTLQDGRSFLYQVSEVKGELKHIKIEIK